MKVLILFLIVGAGCTAPRPTGGGATAVQTGEATAKSAADSAREAEKANNTGLLIASSRSEEPTSQPAAEPAEDIAPAPTVLEVEFVKGTLTQGGEPIVDFGKVAAAAVATDPDVVLSITSNEEVDHAKVVEVTDAAKAAGIKRVRVEINVEKTVDEVKPEPAPAKKAPAEKAK